MEICTYSNESCERERKLSTKWKYQKKKLYRESLSQLKVTEVTCANIRSEIGHTQKNFLMRKFEISGWCNFFSSFLW